MVLDFQEWGKGHFLLLKWPFPHSRFGHYRNKNLRPLLNRNIPLISRKYGLRNHFWPLESVFLMRKSEKKGPNFWGTLLPILRLESSCNFWKFGIKRNDGYFFLLDGSSGPMWGGGDEDEQVWGSCDEEETSPGMCLPRPNWTALCETWGDVLASIFAQAKTKLSQSMISVWFSLNAVSMFSHKPKFKTWIRPQSNLNLFSDC